MSGLAPPWPDHDVTACDECGRELDDPDFCPDCGCCTECGHPYNSNRDRRRRCLNCGEEQDR